MAVLPVLYSYRRCPYAMRARMALHYADISVEVREIALKAKPAHMLQLSPKGTVPVLVLPDGSVIDESLDIMRWALQQHDPEGWLGSQAQRSQAESLIAENDGPFKRALDQYKYAIRFPEQPPETYRAQGEVFLKQLEMRLHQHTYLLSDQTNLADIAIFPFVRQFSMVDEAWFEATSYHRVKAWLQAWLLSERFSAIMQKYPTYVD